MRILPLLLLLAPGLGLAEANPELDKANRLLFDQKYADAARALDSAAKVSGNSREVVLRIYELQGIVYGQLGQATKAREAFQSMLSLDPKRDLNGKYNQKVLNAFAAAKDWSDANPALDFKSAKAALDAKNRVMQLAAKVKSDTMKLTRKVRFHLRPDEGRWVQQDSELQGAYAAANTDAAGVEWWAELLGDNERVLAVVGAENDPVREGTAKDKAPAPVVVADVPKKEESTVIPPPPVEEKKPEVKEEVRAEPGSNPSNPLRPVSYGLMGAGVVALGVGAFFGGQSFSLRGQIKGAKENMNGLVTGMTQRQAFALEQQASSSALIANVLFVAGGAVAVTGGICWLVSGTSSSSSEASLRVAPTLGGVVVSGGF